MTSGSDSYPKV